MRQHPNEGAVLKYPVMHERCAGVDRREDHQCMGQNFVHLFHIVGKGRILQPRRWDDGKAEQLQRIATRKLSTIPATSTATSSA